MGLAYRTDDGVLHFMHASAPRNYGKVVVDSRLSEYLQRYRTIAGILVAGGVLAWFGIIPLLASLVPNEKTALQLEKFGYLNMEKPFDPAILGDPPLWDDRM